ncbi:hypothetical protein [Hymenobacter ruber]
MKSTAASKLLLVFGILVSFACNCKWFETNAQLEELYNESDLVLVGQPIKSINPQKRHPNAKYLGFDILLKVTSVEKGEVKVDTVLILQDNSNCARAFMPKENVIVFGTKIKNVQARNVLDDNADLGYNDKDSSYYYPANDLSYSLYKGMYARYTTVTTSQCISFATREKLVADFVHAKKRR